MAFKNFRLICTLRVVVLAATIALLFHLIHYTDLYATPVIVGLTILYQIWSLINYVERTNRDLSRFLFSIEKSDFSQSFSGHGFGHAYEELQEAFNAVIDRFRHARSEKEEHYSYLQTVVQHIGIGLITFRPNGEIDLINNAAKRLLGVSQLTNMHKLYALNPKLAHVVTKAKVGEKTLVKVEHQGELLQLSLSATEFKQRDQVIKLVSMQNITSELAEREMEAWQKLVRVLTHEIVNSITPISSLASTVNGMLKGAAGEPTNTEAHRIDRETLTDVLGAIGAIEKRSDGLLHFIDAYRSLTHIPNPRFEIVPVADLFARVVQLVSSRKDAADVTITSRVEPVTLEVTADPDLIEQVLLNLMINALHALAGQSDASIELVSHLGDRGRVVMQVIDNGPGIEQDALDKIFIPFFSTKPGGTGIGLSLSHQLMRLHKGDLTAASSPHERTVFTMRF